MTAQILHLRDYQSPEELDMILERAVGRALGYEPERKPGLNTAEPIYFAPESDSA